MKKLAQFIKVLGDGNRLAIIQTIGVHSLSVTEIISATGLSQTLVSFHLRALRKNKIVVTRREGPFIYYKLIDPYLIEIIGELSRVAGLESAETRDPNTLAIANR